MPTNLVRTRRDEKLWQRAKRIVTGEYGLTERRPGPRKRFYRLVVGVFEGEKGRRRNPRPRSGPRRG